MFFSCALWVVYEVPRTRRPVSSSDALRGEYMWSHEEIHCQHAPAIWPTRDLSLYSGFVSARASLRRDSVCTLHLVRFKISPATANPCSAEVPWPHRRHNDSAASFWRSAQRYSASPPCIHGASAQELRTHG